MSVWWLRYRFIVLSSLSVLILALIFTWPVILNPFRIIFGYSGDNFGNIWFFWWQNYAVSHGLNPSFSPFYDAPLGVRINLSSAELAWQIPFGLISKVISPIFAFNFFVILSFFLSFWTMFLLTYYLWKNKLVSFWSGLIYAFSPFHYWQLLSHVSLSYVQWLPLFVWSLFYFDRRKTFRATLFLMFSFVLTTLSSFYYGYFSALIAVVFFVWRILGNFQDYFRFKVVSYLFIAGLLVLVFLTPTLSSVLASKKSAVGQSLSTAFQRQLDELVALSARPWDFLIYPPNHPVFGQYHQDIYDFIQSKGSDFKVRSAYLPERVVFVGWLNFLLALLAVGLILLKKIRWRTLVFLLLVSFIISLPPYFIIKGVTFYTPSYFLYKVLPLFRVYVRMGVYVLLFTTLLASLVLAKFLESRRSRLLVVICQFSIVAISLFEFWPQPSAFTDLRVLPSVYRWLRETPGDFIVAEYPTAFDLQSGLIFQTFHEKRLFNMTSDSPRYKIWEEVASLERPETFTTLKAAGVKYVIYHLSDLTPNPYDGQRFFRSAPRPPAEKLAVFRMVGFRLAQEFPEALVLEIN